MRSALVLSFLFVVSALQAENTATETTATNTAIGNTRQAPPTVALDEKKQVNLSATDTTAAESVSADLRIGFVNFRRIMAVAPQRDEINEKLEREFGVERDALLQAQSELRALERQLESLPHGDAYNDFERQVVSKRRDVTRRDNDYRDNINVRRNEEMAKLQKMIGDEIISLAKEARYDIILNDIGVFYVSERADLSAAVIERLKRKAAGATP
ncbi:MAG: OmpH family outer membrane protein [Cardiobacteriaceae bacterium]|nr:OmpH family outer membrane protein [Cardiobacteriaceae bacterium]